MHADNAVVDLAAAAEPLPRRANGLVAALGGAGLIETADRLRMRVFTGDQPLAVVAHACLIPLDRFHETL